MKGLLNPPDIAVALNYDGVGAPRVTAKGKGEVARQLMAVAREHQVPLHGNPQLAQTLSTIPLGDEIPEELYRAVAEIIAFAYFLSAKIETVRDLSAPRR